MNESALVPYEAGLPLPDEVSLKRELTAVARFQAIVRVELKDGHDYGVIPGAGNKPTLLKPGAEKIAKLLGLADEYEVEKTEDWEKGFFRYLVRCRLTKFGTGAIVSMGLGECNSMESKYRWRWVFSDSLPSGVDKTKLVTRKVKNGGTQYRLENEDIYSQVNTLLKMAKKRALVDAALSAGRLSDLFTQDIEELKENGVLEGEGGTVEETPAQTEHYCAEHKTAFFKRGNMKGFAHPIEGTKEWHNEPAESTSPPKAPEAQPSAGKHDAKWLVAQLDQEGITQEEAKKILGMTLGNWLASGKTLDDAWEQISFVKLGAQEEAKP